MLSRRMQWREEALWPFFVAVTNSFVPSMRMSHRPYIHTYVQGWLGGGLLEFCVSRGAHLGLELGEVGVITPEGGGPCWDK